MRRGLLFIALAGILLGAWPMECRAAGRVIAAMMSSDQPRYREAHRAFVVSLAGRGYTSANTEIILQSPNPDPHSWSNTVRKFNAHRPALIVAYGAPAALVAMKESDGIPVVAADMYAQEKPPRGMCGVSSRVPLLLLFNTLQDIRNCRRIGVLYTAREAGSQRQFEEIRKLAIPLGMSVEGANVASSAALETALSSLLERVDVIVATESGAVFRQFERVVARAKARNVPVLSTIPDAAEKGALASLEISPQEQGHLAAEIAARILEGARAEHLSLLTPQRIDFIINLRVAREMGISVPFSVLGSATRVLK